MFDLQGLLILLLFAIGVVAALAPMEALEWWAGWSHGREGPDDPPITRADVRTGDRFRRAGASYIVYLSGVARLTGDERGRKEEAFLNALQARLPDAVIVRDLFPYSVTDNPLTGERTLAPFWGWLASFDPHSKLGFLRGLFMLRNIAQVGVSADPRYGPVYGYGVSREAVEHLVRLGYPLDSSQPVTLLALSGGGQIAVSVAPFVKKMLDAPVTVISMGGVLTSDRSILAVDHLYQLAGSKDSIQAIGKVMYPGRWPLARRSAWNRAWTQGKITWIDVGPMKHMGHGDYMSPTTFLSNGQSYLDKTLDEIVAIVERSAKAAVAQEAPSEAVHV